MSRKKFRLIKKFPQSTGRFMTDAIWYFNLARDLHFLQQPALQWARFLVWQKKFYRAKKFKPTKFAGALKAGADDRICSRCRADCCRETRSNSRFGKSFCTDDFKFGVQGSRND